MHSKNHTLIIATLFLTIVTSLTFAALNDSGLTTCSNATQNGLSCPVSGFPGQDAEYGTNSFDFTKIDTNGNELPINATNHACVQDNVTGLMWEVKTADGGLRDQNNTYTFASAAQFASQVNANGGICGFTDWRVPDPHELLSIVNHNIADPDPTIDLNFFPNTLSTYFWTNSPYVAVSSSAWTVNFNTGGITYYSQNNAYGAVRLVRNDPSIFSFIDNNDGTVTDTNTGLMWAKCSHGQTWSGTYCNGNAETMTWATALTIADSTTLAGYADWRLPNVKELQSIVDYNRYGPAILSNYFPNTYIGMYWTASAYTNKSYYSWYVNFQSGRVDSLSRSSDYAVRLVRNDNLPPLSLTINKLGTGTGTVISNPSGINCGSVCQANFKSGSTVTLTATPTSADSVFSSWSSNCANGQITMTANTSCTATFNIPVVTNAADVITATSAKLNGSVISNNAVATVSFDFGLTTAYGTNIVATPSQVYSSTAVAVSATKTNLTCNTSYHYRVKAVTSATTFNGKDQSFTACFTVTASAETGGIVTPTTQTVINGTTATFTVTPNTGYTTNAIVGGTCPQGNWNGNVWTTGAITGNCSVNFNFKIIDPYSVTATAGTGGTVTPTTRTVTYNATTTFTVTPNTGYTTNAIVGGTCPQGNWNGNVWTTGAITGNCSVNFNFKIIDPYSVTATAGTGGTVTPTTHTVTYNATTTFTVTPNTGYTTNAIVGGTCPQGNWNGNVWTTGAITGNCYVNFSFKIKTYSVTATVGTGGTVATATQTVIHGAKTTFTVTPNTGYTRNSAVTGTCPSGTWNGSVWTTGTITANCSVSFSFTLIPIPGVCGSANGNTFNTAPTTNLCSSGIASVVTGTGPWNWSCNGQNGGTSANCSAIYTGSYTVTPSVGANGTISPSTPQIVAAGALKSFTVKPNVGYIKDFVVTGTCPQGSWNEGSRWTTGPITGNCTVIFNFTESPTAWLSPTNPYATVSGKLTLDLRVDSFGSPINNYNFNVNFDPTKLRADLTFQDESGTCQNGVCKGANALSNWNANVDYVTGKITLTGIDNQGVAPSNNLELVKIHFLAMPNPSVTSVNLTLVNLLTNGVSQNIGNDLTGNALVTVQRYKCGDANGDTFINIIDALAIARQIIGLPPPPSITPVADVSGNGEISIVDALHIARYSVGLVVVETCLM